MERRTGGAQRLERRWGEVRDQRRKCWVINCRQWRTTNLRRAYSKLSLEGEVTGQSDHFSQKPEMKSSSLQTGLKPVGIQRKRGRRDSAH